MSKKEYGKGWTVDDLMAQCEAKWDMLRKLTTTVTFRPAEPEPPPELFRGPIWPKVTYQGKEYFKVDGYAVMPSQPDPLQRAQRNITNLYSAIQALEAPGWQAANPSCPAGGGGGRSITYGEGAPAGYAGVPGSSSAIPFGTYMGMPVYADEAVARGQMFGFSTEPMSGPGVRSTQVGWVRPEPPPDLPTGRFQNLDWENS